ncbi:PLDc_N domain-containing protein [Methanohalophilus portucalensis FDF-1]|uniref:PLDc_N domain-containing protein n=3 Tax=Methanohalophilus portucalensis TaxID=39664 RepID=A0A1X7NA78_9EURY|nr:hypothetical protein BKM01_06575 [Methanohalophilus portucalensis]RNI13365.1 PLDc_N domain-containing protein [Methanohalophilus portucalensis FDF-1]SMH33652.1 Phospholipase_D-nuclease N-terminal [Methanohalophilus portucalensis FDF-1]
MNKNTIEWIIIGIIFVTIITVAFYMGQLLWGVGAIVIVFWLFMLSDCLQRSTENFPRAGEYEKLIWSIVLIFLNFIGAILYYYMVKLQDNNIKISEDSTY